MPQGAGDFGERVSTALADRPSVAERNLESFDGYWRIDGFDNRVDRYYGAFLRLRTTSDAKVARVDEIGLRDLKLPKNEVLTEFFGFAYDPQYQILVVHRNRDAGRHGRLQLYAEHLTHINDIDFALVLSEDDAKRIDSMGFKSKIELTLARPENLASADQERSVLHLARLSHLSKSALLTVTMSVGHTKQSLSDDVFQSVVKLAGLKSDTVRSAKVRGRVDGEMVWIDLIEGRMKESVDIASQGPLTLESVFGALDTAYSRREGEIGRLFSAPGSG